MRTDGLFYAETKSKRENLKNMIPSLSINTQKIPKWTRCCGSSKIDTQTLETRRYCHAHRRTLWTQSSHVPEHRSRTQSSVPSTWSRLGPTVHKKRLSKQMDFSFPFIWWLLQNDGVHTTTETEMDWYGFSSRSWTIVRFGWTPEIDWFTHCVSLEFKNDDEIVTKYFLWRDIQRDCVHLQSGSIHYTWRKQSTPSVDDIIRL